MEAIQQQFISQQATSRGWRVLQIYSLYRLCLVVTLLLLNIFDFGYDYLGATNPLLFIDVISVYLAFTIVALVTAYSGSPRFNWQVPWHLLVDITVLVILVNISSEVNYSFGVLINIAIAAASILLSGRASLYSAGYATFGLLFEHAVTSQNGFYWQTGYVHLGILGFTFFATAIIAHVLTERLRVSEAVASQRGLDLANLEFLNEHIIQRMRSGVVVVDDDLKVRQINKTAKSLLGVGAVIAMQHLSKVCHPLYLHMLGWMQGDIQAMSVQLPGFDLTAQFLPLGEVSKSGALIFLDDMSQTAQQAQQMKLASLGRFTASMAHELRNPLGAIGHAVQLLQESTDLHDDEQRLAQIIATQADRMNSVIKNILQLSRRHSAVAETFDLNAYLQQFTDEFKASTAEKIMLELQSDVSPNEVTIDKSQLRQVLCNLCENGLRHSKEVNPVAKVILKVSKDFTGKVMLTVCDDGSGIDESISQNIFEPFFTTGRQGTGLGLYIARELCEANQVRLSLVPSDKGACFRIVFTDGV